MLAYAQSRPARCMNSQARRRGPAAGRRRCQTHITSQCNIVEAPPNDTRAMVTITLGSGQGWRRNLAPVAGPGELAS